MAGLRVLVCGGRDYSDRDTVFETLDALTPRPTIIIHGHAAGADSLADAWARERGVSIAGFRAQWELHGNAAGPLRNQRMIDVGRPDLVIVFPGGKGTADMVRRALNAGIEFRLIAPSPEVQR